MAYMDSDLKGSHPSSIGWLRKIPQKKLSSATTDQ